MRAPRVAPAPLGTLLCLALVAAALLGDARADEADLASLIDVIELEFEDQCNAKGETDWKELLGKPNALHAKLEQDKAIGNTMRNQYDLKVESAGYDMNSPHNPQLSRKLELLLAPGDPLLDIDQWNRLVSFGDETVHNLESASDYNCGGDPNEACTLADVRRRLASEQGEGVRKRIKSSWEKKLPDENKYITQILPLLINASKVNGYDTVEQYWEALVESEGAMVKARELWEQVQPLYEKLQKYVAIKLTAAGFTMNTDTSIPVYALGTLLGDDWTNAVEHVLPKHAEIYELIKKNLLHKHMGGREAFVKASKLIKDLNLGEVSKTFWVESVFDKTCPTKLVDFCLLGNMRAFTCNDISLPNYLDAHEAIMKVKYRELGAAYSNNTHILREPNRYSGVYEGIAGLASLLALTPHQLDRSKLVPIKYFETNPEHNKIVLQLILALQDLPRLNYYLAADEWRLKTLREVPAPIPLGQSWSNYRRSFSLVAPGDKDFLGDPHILFNKPFLGKFMGIFLKYQIYQSFVDDMYNADADIVSQVAQNQNRLIEPMTRAFSVKWPELVSDILAKREYSIDSAALTDYFGTLDGYLDKELDPNPNDLFDTFEQPDSSDSFETTSEKQIEDIIDNEIDHSEALEAQKKEDIKLDLDATSENALENRHLIEKENMPATEEEASAPLQKADNAPIKEGGAYSIYMWIGIGVVIAIILILILIIAKKRYSHRKELERERKESSRA